jgi:SCY1-like protein 2
MTLENDKLGMTKEVIATKVLPFLFPLSIENGLTIGQYNVIMALIRKMIGRVEEEHKVKLEQLNSIQDEQR